ncbi:PAS-domain containing protein [Phreatobacter sp.]|uniref:sensor histidine kinase n=1 Tax=Phreatobacter sp. TaxID=1966341 RepID=UPI003F6EF300
MSSTALAGAAEAGAEPVSLMAAIRPHEWAILGLNVGVVVFAVVTSISLLRTRTRTLRAEKKARDEINGLKLALDRANELLTLDDHVVVVWGGERDEPEITGDATLITDLPAPRRVLAFGSWLPPVPATQLEEAVSRLRGEGTPFRFDLVAADGRPIEAEGRPIGGRAVLRLRVVTGVREELGRLRETHAAVLRDTDTFRSFLTSLPMPVWTRDREGRLTWANDAYAAATDRSGGAEAVAAGCELIEPADRSEAARRRQAREPFVRRTAAIAAGHRRVFDVIERPAGTGFAGMAVDVTELDNARSELAVEMETHKRTLDQLQTAVAIFDANRRLVFNNEAYRQLWDLDPAFLHQSPTDGDILDRLRERDQLPAQSNYREWKKTFHTVYEALDTEPRIHEWPLSGKRFLRVIQNPDPAGGVTYVFEDLTQRLALETQVKALDRVQRETIDHLEEAVAVFGPDGRLSLFNRAFGTLWEIAPALLESRPRIDQIADLCLPYVRDGSVWSDIRSAVTALAYERRQHNFRMERTDGSVLDTAAAPLPGGATLVTFRNVTDMVMVERALTERNEALEAAARMRNDFVHHVSYQLRTPLTTIIGFSQVLDDPSVGPLNDRQREYLGYIAASSASLLSIINDVLDLATIDAGVMELELSDVDIKATILAVAEAIGDRLAEHRIRLETRIVPEIGSFRADAQRVRQMLFNLLTNAIGFSEPGGLIVLDATRTEEDIVFRIRDQGAGIAPEMVGRIFDRFETRTTGSRHRGAGLGLSIVQSFVNLHKGRIHVDSSPGKGTQVTVALPANLDDLSKAAE